MVYTRWKCDRYWAYAPKLMLGEYPQLMAVTVCMTIWLWKNASYCSEETERKHGWWVGYPFFRDPIARRNEDKYKRMIRDNDIDICHPMWTGVSKEKLAC
eukprot:Tbor_TRINITY_DN5083_c0_g3::TRINITY_DN5083_c0_g3_i1::g.14239::m.14239